MAYSHATAVLALSVVFIAGACSSASSTSSSPQPFERITAQEAAKRVTQCGLGPVTTRYDAELQEDILTAADAKSATDEQLACADKSVGFYTLELPSKIQPRYDAIRETRLSGVFRAEARAWLAARKLIDKVPKYHDGVTDDVTFTRQIEGLCGPRAKGAFQSTFGFHALSPDWVKSLGMPPKQDEQDAMSCLLNATAVAGYKVGFIGNEYYKSK